MRNTVIVWIIFSMFTYGATPDSKLPIYAKPFIIIGCVIAWPIFWGVAFEQLVISPAIKAEKDGECALLCIANAKEAQ